MVTHKEGSVLESGCRYICHQVNCRGAMGSGIALAIKTKWPIVYAKYMDKVRDTEEQCLVVGGHGELGGPDPSRVLLGNTQFVDVGNGQKVVNMFAQQSYGYDGKRYTSYDAFEHCLQDIKKTAPKGSTIGFPYKIGSDRGGANWDIIEKMIEVVLGDDFSVEVYHWKG